ncbi:hypothetical protein MUK42_32912 [Musa troglodytarum]|uniref:Uncharacterized protein n=1 Tax=Musa troglodytarum TaxID=320322 RepID=A0A9E7F9A8_9LILI|nr:hypothetical protein MUK42_32912 [Musa troglodytarum]
MRLSSQERGVRELPPTGIHLPKPLHSTTQTPSDVELPDEAGEVSVPEVPGRRLREKAKGSMTTKLLPSRPQAITASVEASSTMQQVFKKKGAIAGPPPPPPWR